MKSVIIVFPGSNCDRDVAVALKNVTNISPIMHWHADLSLPDADIIVIPGGFAYGDYLRPGAMSAHSPIMSEIVKRANKGIPVLGICNGFQILTEAGLLPGTLMTNSSLEFTCRDTHMRIENNQSLFTSQYKTGTVISFPVAHHTGQYYAAKDTINQLENSGQIAFRYCNVRGEITIKSNPSGSINNIAGIFNKERTVLGTMPHPERAADPLHSSIDGRMFFDGIVKILG